MLQNHLNTVSIYKKRFFIFLHVTVELCQQEMYSAERIAANVPVCSHRHMKHVFKETNYISLYK